MCIVLTFSLYYFSFGQEVMSTVVASLSSALVAHLHSLVATKHLSEACAAQLIFDMHFALHLIPLFETPTLLHDLLSRLVGQLEPIRWASSKSALGQSIEAAVGRASVMYGGLREITGNVGKHEWSLFVLSEGTCARQFLPSALVGLPSSFSKLDFLCLPSITNC